MHCGPDLAGETTAIEFGRTLLLLSIALVYQLLAVDTRMLSDILILREKWQSNFVVTFFKALDSRHQSSLGSSLAPFSTAWTTIICFFQAYQKMSAIVNLEKEIFKRLFIKICFLSYPKWNGRIIVSFFRLEKMVSKFPIQNALSFYCVMFTKYLSWNKKSLWWVAHVKSANSSLNALHSAESLHKNEEARIWFFTHMLLECNEGFLASSTTLRNNQQHDNDRCC